MERVWHILRSRFRSIAFSSRRESQHEARLQALRLFGGVEQVKEECRDTRGTASFDALVRDALRRAGVPRETVENAVSELEPEKERARRIVARRGASPRTARYLAGKGFSPETVAAVVASETFDTLG